jgi:transposase
MSTPSTTTSTKADSFRRVEVITGVGRRRRWTDEEKAWIVAESLDPATTVSAVARRYGLHASQLFVWRQRLAAPAAREAPAFVPVVVAEDARPRPRWRAGWRIALGPVVVRVGADVDAAALRRVLEVVRGLRDRGPARGAHPARGRAGRLQNGMDGLAALVQQALQADPFAGDVFIFRPSGRSGEDPGLRRDRPGPVQQAAGGRAVLLALAGGRRGPLERSAARDAARGLAVAPACTPRPVRRPSTAW